MKFKFKTSTSILALAISQATLTPVFATENEAEIERVLVTGDFKEESIQTLSASASVFSKQDIDLRGATALDEILNATANVNFTAGASRGRFMQIRGVGLRSQFVDPINPSVGVVIDGINYSGLGGAALLFDTEQVEIYRGPQGTRFGADALAGMIHIETANPLKETNVNLKLGAGNYNAKEAGIAFGTGISDDTAFKVSTYQAQSDGFVENAYLERDDTQGRDEKVSRFKLDSQLTESLNTKLTLHYIDINNGYDGFTLDNSRMSVADEPGQDNQESLAIGLANTFTGFDFADVIFNVSGISSELLYRYDEDWVCNDPRKPKLCSAGLHASGYSTKDSYDREREDRSAELIMSGKEGDWVSGIYYQSRDVDLTRDFFNWGLYDYDTFKSIYDTQNVALFAQIETKINEKTTLITGLRVEQNDGDYNDNNAIVKTTSDTMLGGKIAVEYQVIPRTMIYTSLSRGYKAGGINGEALAKAKDDGLSNDHEFYTKHTSFEPEYLYNAEFGVKGSSADNKLILRLAAFYMYRDNIQLKDWNIQATDNGQEQFTGFYANGSSGSNYGLEVESSYQLTDNLSLNASFGYLESKINDYVTKKGLDQDGREQAQSPKYQYAVNVKFDATDNIYVSLGVEGKDDYYFSDGHNSKSESTNLVNAKIAYTQNDWELSAWARNLFDEDYAVRGFEFGNDPHDDYSTNTYVQYGEPMVAGVSFNYNF
ncbi:TonB-dependent receptor [Pseudoalteromonas denitrificans]|uniref:Outer membrane receptor proteins, mostly Fe transport n=1 Tax=Pseudoalteromonas denitrificans DSM 6059 TaxID=1123010 RepID=A0A1I1JZR5_9GAMM|nr:TonB-dependent receptor [Pseudoalteromonas denitrificans]SFC53996.1 Outer membrane receptor proteins, mostly Fe transport [Pseudoalteromonas denitrificans DSM 6059]